MGAASERLAHVVSDGSHVRTGADAGAELRATGVEGQNLELSDLDLDRLEPDFLLFAGELVSGNSFDFLRGERGRRMVVALGSDRPKCRTLP